MDAFDQQEVDKFSKTGKARRERQRKQRRLDVHQRSNLVDCVLRTEINRVLPEQIVSF